MMIFKCCCWYAPLKDKCFHLTYIAKMTKYICMPGSQCDFLLVAVYSHILLMIVWYLETANSFN